MDDWNKKRNFLQLRVLTFNKWQLMWQWLDQIRPSSKILDGTLLISDSHHKCVPQRQIIWQSTSCNAKLMVLQCRLWQTLGRFLKTLKKAWVDIQSCTYVLGTICSYRRSFHICCCWCLSMNYLCWETLCQNYKEDFSWRTVKEL